MLSAKENNFDVVLIDTAGRMQDNEVRMRAKFNEFFTDAVSSHSH